MTTAATVRHERQPAAMSASDKAAATPGQEADAQWRDWPEFAAHLESAIDAGGAALIRLDLLDIADLQDTYGARTVAMVLAVTQSRLEAFARPRGGVISDGGARFAVFVADLHDPAELARAAEVMCAAAMTPIAVLGHSLRLGACVGAAQSAPDRANAAALRGRADCALEAARRAGPGAHRLFSAEMRTTIRSRTVLRQALQQAITERQFRLHYQPVVRMTDRVLIGAEALARWEHPALGLQSPAQFIPAAEETGLIVPLGTQVLDMALAQLREWRATGRGAPRVAVNVAAAQIRPDFATIVRRALDTAGVSPTLLELELTEGALIDSDARTVSVLAELAGMGVTLAVDDFGTGYSSLRYLRDLPVQVLKIDQTFVRNLAADSRDAPIVAAIVAMARGLGLTTTAEGVQTEAQYRQLRDVGCDNAQGWLFGAPARPEVFPPPLG